MALELLKAHAYGNDFLYLEADAFDRPDAPDQVRPAIRLVQKIERRATRIGSLQTRAFIAGIRGVTTGIANAIPVLIDSSGQLGTVSSSARYKEDIADMADVSERLMALPGKAKVYAAEVSGRFDPGA